MNRVIKLMCLAAVLAGCATVPTEDADTLARKKPNCRLHPELCVPPPPPPSCATDPSLCPPPPPPPPPPVAPIPEISLWESNMKTYGKKHCDVLTATKDGPIDPPLFGTYYDAGKVFQLIADYTKDASWYACSDVALYVYRDRYSIPNNGAVPGYWNFTTGELMDFLRTGNLESKKAIVLQSQNAAYCQDTAPLEWGATSNLSREVAYCINSYIDSEKVGEARRARRQLYVDLAYGHIDQFVDKANWGDKWAQPFMMGLTAHSLIRDWEETKDARLIPALRKLADFMWIDAWVEENQGMIYSLNPLSPEGGRGTTGAPDLNNLIAPMYAFLYQQTGELKYLEQGDKLFAGGARFAYLDGPKQFNQSYTFSFDYVKRRTSAAVSLMKKKVAVKTVKAKKK